MENTEEDPPMLILNPKRGETLKIGDDIDVIVLDMQGNQVLIGIRAPPDIAICREEIHRRIRQEGDGE